MSSLRLERHDQPYRGCVASSWQATPWQSTTLEAQTRTVVWRSLQMLDNRIQCLTEQTLLPTSRFGTLVFVEYSWRVLKCGAKFYSVVMVEECYIYIYWTFQFRVAVHLLIPPQHTSTGTFFNSFRLIKLICRAELIKKCYLYEQ